MSRIDELLAIIEKVRPHCQEGDPSGGWCKRTAVFRVEWSDRVTCCCAEHLDMVKHYAATDNISDRTDSPYVQEICDPEIAAAADAALTHISNEPSRSDGGGG